MSLTGSALASSPRTRMSFRGFAPVGVIRLLRDLSYFGNRFIEKQKSRHFCNFFAIRDSFLFLQSGNRLPNGRLPAFLHRNPRSGEPITIPNRKKVAIRAEFLFLFSLRWLVLGRHRGRATQARHRETSGRGGPGTAHGIPSDALRHSGVVCMATLRANAECRTKATENPH